MKSSPILTVKNDPGTVEITNYATEHMEEAVANQISRTYKGGKACVLTNTNYEALQIQGILKNKGIRAKLIQSNDGFKLCNLAEIRYFLKLINTNLNSPVIDDTTWSNAKKQLSETYSESTCLPNCINMLNEFESVNSVKFRTDLDEFIKESNYEDFYMDESEVIYVSTIHKSKGREFDTVYLLLKNTSALSDEERRKLYVAMTRAKESLYIHCNTDIFSKYCIDGIIKRKGTANYDEPSEITLELTHRDIFLNFFKNKKETILKLRSGDELMVNNNFLCAEINNKFVSVVKFSNAFREKLEALKSKGYTPVSAQIGYIVAWQGEEDNTETAIILPILRLKQSNNTNQKNDK